MGVPTKFFDGKKITVRYNDIIIDEFFDEKKADDYLRKINKDKGFFDGEIKRIKNNRIGEIPNIKNFNNWFDNLTSEDFEFLWKDINLRRKVERRLRYPGGYHEWLMVSRTNIFKRWGVSAYEIRTLRTKIIEVIFKNPPGKHGGKGSTKAHNEILKIIDNSENYEEFVSKLINWAENRLEGGKNKTSR
jgi:hypothetical protein